MGHVCGGLADEVEVKHAPPTGASSPGVPAANSSQMPEVIRHLAGCHLTAPRQVTTPLYRSGLPTVAGATMPSANFYGAVREDSSALSPVRIPRRSPAVTCHTFRA